jgi:hypothetical protein
VGPDDALRVGLWWRGKSDTVRPDPRVLVNEAETVTGERQDFERHHETDRGGGVPCQWLTLLHALHAHMGAAGEGFYRRYR